MNGRTTTVLLALLTFALGIVSTGFVSMWTFGNKITRLESLVDRVEALEESQKEHANKPGHDQHIIKYHSDGGN